MAHFAYVQDGVVQRVEVVDNAVLLDQNGQESEAVGQAFLASLYPGTDPADFIQTSYNGNPVHGVDRGPYAGMGFTWDGSTFAVPAAPQ